MKNPEELRESLIDDLELFDKDYLIKSIICFLPQSQLEELKDYDVITENERGMSQEFVMHGANLAGQVKILRNAKKEKPRGDREIIKKQINVWIKIVGIC